MKSLEICGENFVNSQNDYILNNGGNEEYLYDQKPSSVCASSGSSEGAAWTVQTNFKDRLGAQALRTIDRLIILNHNLAQFYVEYWNESTGDWSTIAESVFNVGAPNAATNLYIELAASITTKYLRLTATNTIGAVTEKSIGELKACLFVTAVRHLVTLERMDWDDGDNYRLQGGSLITFNQVQKMEGNLKIVDMTDATWQLIKEKISLRQWMTLVLYSDFDAAEVYEVKAVAQPNIIFNRKTQLYEVSFRVAER